MCQQERNYGGARSLRSTSQTPGGRELLPGATQELDERSLGFGDRTLECRVGVFAFTPDIPKKGNGSRLV